MRKPNNILIFPHHHHVSHIVIKSSPNGKWIVNMKDDFNKRAYQACRQAYCPRVCYVIGEDGRILDKFAITDWKLNLPQLLGT